MLPTTPQAVKFEPSRNKSMAPKTLPSFSLENKVCLVTGAARGLGYEFCKAFAQSGSTSIIILDLKDSEAKAAAEELTTCAISCGLSKSDIKYSGIECDVSSEDSVKNAFEQIINVYGRIDVVVASAGIVENFSALEYPADRIRKLFNVNILGVMFTAREAARHMIPQGGGSIILIASMSANIINIPQYQTPYNASKAAVKHMASSLAYEWAKQGIRVNALSPGYMLTPLVKTVLANSDPEMQKTWESLTPMGRMGNPEDLAGAIVFLASDASKFMTGSEVRVDGGYCVI